MQFELMEQMRSTFRNTTELSTIILKILVPEPPTRWRQLELAGFLVNKQQGNLEENIPNQKPGLLVSNHKNHSGNILVWYRDSKKILKSRAVEYDGFVSNFYVYNIT